jgi:hypothetical protein
MELEMSTRCAVTVKDDRHTFHIYRHGDGYPDGPNGVPATLGQAIPFAWPLPRFEAMDFAAAIIRAWKERGGGNIYFCADPDLHGDLEWRYTVTFENGALQIEVFDVYEGAIAFKGSFEGAVAHFAPATAYTPGAAPCPPPAKPRSETMLEHAQTIAFHIERLAKEPGSGLSRDAARELADAGRSLDEELDRLASEVRALRNIVASLRRKSERQRPGKKAK